MLEELGHARARGAPILAEFMGGSFTCDAHHMTEPHPQGAGVQLCIERCKAEKPSCSVPQRPCAEHPAVLLQSFGRAGAVRSANQPMQSLARQWP